MGLGEAKLNLADKGLCAIQGVNNDDSSANSNGAGKSSLADALCWCLWGETARDKLGADEVVNRKVGKNTRVVVQALEEDGSFFTITRWRKHKDFPKKSGVSIVYTSPTGDEVDLTKGTDALTQLEIDKALGCTKDVFLAAVYAGQEKLPNLPAMSDGELKQLIEKASGVDLLVSAYAIARQKLKEAEADQDRWRANHVRIERDVATAKDRKDKMIVERDSFETKRTNNINILTEQVKEHVLVAKKFQAERDTVDQARIEAEIAKLDAKIDAVKAEQTEEDALLADERDAQAKMTTVTAHFNRAVEDAQRQKKKIADISNQVGKPCTECGKACEEHDIEQVKALAEEQLRLLVDRAKELKSDVEEHQKVVDRRVAALKEHRAARTDVSAVVTERKRFAELLAARKRSEDALATATANARRVKEQVDRAKTEENPFVAIVETAEREMEDAANEFRESEVAGVAYERRIQVCREVVKVYGPAGVRAHVLDTVTPFLNSRTADYLTAMSDGNISAVWSTLSLNAKSELIEKFAINVEKGIGGGSFASLSGGEKRKVRLSCALALQDLVASRASKPIEFMIYDEVDTALDDAGLERLMNVFEQKGRERGTVLVISHNNISDFIREIVTVTMDGGTSTVEGVLNLV